MNRMKVNIEKTKVVIFRRGGRLRKQDRFFNEGKKLEIVTHFTYLGVPFSSSGKFFYATEHFKNKGLAAVGAVLGIIMRFKLFIVETLGKSFESIVESTTTYCCSIWGYASARELEKVQMSYYKRILGLTKLTPNYLVRLELGLEPIVIKIIRKQLGLLVRILREPELELARNCLQHLKIHRSKEPHYNWFWSLRNRLEIVQQGWIVDQLDSDIIVQNQKEKIKKLQVYFASEDDERAKNSSYFTGYKKESTIGEPEQYLKHHMNKLFTRCIASLRPQVTENWEFILRPRHK